MSTFKPHTNTHTVQYILRFSHSIFSLCVARGWGILPKLLGGGVPHDPQTLTLFQTKIYYFSDPFSDPTPKI